MRFAQAFCYPCDTDTLAPSGVDFNEAFEPSVSKKACSLYETDYGTSSQDAMHEELIRFYSYFGLKRSLDSELPDHISIELEFMHFLAHLEHHYLEQEDGEQVNSLRLAQREFLMRHISRLVNGILNKYGGNNVYYKELIETLSEFVASDLSYLKSY